MKPGQEKIFYWRLKNDYLNKRIIVNVRYPDNPNKDKNGSVWECHKISLDDLYHIEYLLEETSPGIRNIRRKTMKVQRLFKQLEGI